MVISGFLLKCQVAADSEKAQEDEQSGQEQTSDIHPEKPEWDRESGRWDRVVGRGCAFLLSVSWGWSSDLSFRSPSAGKAKLRRKRRFIKGEKKNPKNKERETENKRERQGREGD